MDGQRFDAMTRAWTAPTSRRRVVGLLGAALAGAAPFAAPSGGAAVTHDARCPAKKTGKSGGPAVVCDTERDCFCAVAVTGARKCVASFPIHGGCYDQDECAHHGDCGPGAVCVRIAPNCQGRYHAICAPKCTA